MRLGVEGRGGNAGWMTDVWRDFDLHATACFTHIAPKRMETHMLTCADAYT